jgi:hypothetical protein
MLGAASVAAACGVSRQPAAEPAGFVEARGSRCCLGAGFDRGEDVVGGTALRGDGGSRGAVAADDEESCSPFTAASTPEAALWPLPDSCPDPRNASCSSRVNVFASARPLAVMRT